MENEIRLLHEGNYSCVISKGEEIRTFTQRGVADLYDLLKENPLFLKNARIADKVIGKAAAALMVSGGIKKVYADIISTPALSLLTGAGIETNYQTQVSLIMNREQNGWCPLETICKDSDCPEKLFTLIEAFIKKIRQ